MPAEGMSRSVVHANLPEAGFGVHPNLPEAGFEIYERVPKEDEDFGENEMGVGHSTDDGFEGEETCEDSLEEDAEEGE